VGVVVAQSPNFLGGVEDLTAVFQTARAAGAVGVHVFQPYALALYKCSGEMGADVAVGEGQELGTPPSFGGPALGVFAVSRPFVRHIPGRLIGETVDRNGRRCYVMTLRTREQDIRRAKATSNICTNQSLMALRAVIQASLLGPQGLREAAEHCLQRAHYLARAVSSLEGYKLPYSGAFFREFVVRCPRPASEVVSAALARGIVPGLDLGRYREAWRNDLLVCASELHTREDLDALVDCLAAIGKEVVHV
jgi:glycine dehydrogenase subunit 1